MQLREDEAKRWPEYAKYVEACNDPGTKRVGEFIEWVTRCEGHVEFGRWVKEDDGYEKLWPSDPNIEQLMCEWLGIDYKAAMIQKSEAVEEAIAELRNRSV